MYTTIEEVNGKLISHDHYHAEDFDLAVERIRDYVKECEKERDRAKEKVRCWNKDEEIAKRDREIKRLEEKIPSSYSFTISEEEKKKIIEWQKNHKCGYRPREGGPRYAGAVGGLDKFIFTPTSIGIFGKVQCLCGAELIFRDE